MALQTMYPAANSLLVQLTEDISAGVDEITVTDASVFPPAPNFATIGTDNDAEVVVYQGIDLGNNKLTGCLRGQSDTVAKGWTVGAFVYHSWTAANANAMMDNISGLDGAKAEKDHKHGTGDITSGTLPINRGGTGANTAEKARETLGLESSYLLGYGETLGEGADLNDIQEPRTYRSSSSAITASLKNAPPLLAGGIKMTVSYLGSSNYLIQEIHTYSSSFQNNNSIWRRAWISNRWGKWSRLVDTDTSVTWTDVPLLNGFEASPTVPLQYSRTNSGTVHINGAVMLSEAPESGLQIGRLPVGYRPSKIMCVPIMQLRGDPTWSTFIYILPTGYIQFVAATLPLGYRANSPLAIDIAYIAIQEEQL